MIAKRTPAARRSEDRSTDFVLALADWCAQRACAEAKAATEASYRPLPEPKPPKRRRPAIGC